MTFAKPLARASVHGGGACSRPDSSLKRYYENIIFTKAEKDSLTKGGPDATLVLVATLKLTIAGDNPGARVERLVDRMDQFYSHLGNRAISASYAFYIADLQLSGVPDEEIRKWIKACQRASED